MTNKLTDDFLFVIFGGTGDLAHRKLLPAIYHLFKKDLLFENFKVISIGRRDYTTDLYLEQVSNSFINFTDIKVDDEIFKQFAKHINYYRMDFTNNENYANLNTYLTSLNNQKQSIDNRLYYLAVSPDFFATIINGLNQFCMTNKNGFNRLMIEKPFGSDLKSAAKINKLMVDVFGENNIFRVDHYLGKEMLQNILVLRFSNLMLESIWNNKYIEQVQISSNEKIGIEGRGAYYEKTGAIRDMFQSHMLQLLSLTAMEKPRDLTAESIHNEKVKVLQAIKPYTSNDINTKVVRGQYRGTDKIPSYREEKNVDSNSNTETFIALEMAIDNDRWRGVPFYIRTGKRMERKYTEIVIQFKGSDDNLYNNEQIKQNKIIIQIQPMEAIFIKFNAKQPGSLNTIVPATMTFCQNCAIGAISPEAYERLLYDALRGDLTLFARWDEVQLSWNFVDTIINHWNKITPQFPNYSPTENGPEEANTLLEKNGHYWLEEDDYENT